MKMLILLSALISAQVFACGGKELTEADVAQDPQTQIALKKVEALVGEELTLKKIVMSGNNIININEQVVASAMCNANYINIFHSSPRDSRVICHTRGEGNAYGSLKLEVSYCVLANGTKTQSIWY